MNILNQEFIAPAGAMILVIILYVFFFNEKKKVLILFLSILIIGVGAEALAAVKGFTISTIISGPIILDGSEGLNSQAIESLRVFGVIIMTVFVNIIMLKYLLKSEDSIFSNIGIIIYSVGGIQTVFYTLPALVINRLWLIVSIIGYCLLIGVLCTFEIGESPEDSGEPEE